MRPSLQIFLSLVVLVWYIAGIVDLPLGHRLLLIFAGESYFVLCACMHLEHSPADEPGAVAGARGRWRVYGGLNGAR